MTTGAQYISYALKDDLILENLRTRKKFNIFMPYRQSPDEGVFPTDPSRKRWGDGRTVAPEDLVGPRQVEEVVHLSLALWQVDAQTISGRGDIRLRCRRRVGVFHDSLILHGPLSSLSAEK